MNLIRGKCIVLTVIMVLLLQNSSASIYNASCFNKANYLPAGSVDSYTCDFWYNAMSGSGQLLASVNWATVTPAFIAAMADVNGQSMISQFDYWSRGCCSDGKSIVYQNRSGVCLHKSEYTGSKTFSDPSIGWNSGTCDQFITSASDDSGTSHFANFGIGAGKTSWENASSCTDFTAQQKVILTLPSFVTDCCSGESIFDSCPATSPSPTSLQSGTGRLTVSVATMVVVMSIACILGN